MKRNSDRGSLKWTSLMIPEHKKMLQEMYAELEHIEQPELDEQEKERLNQTLITAMEYDRPIQLSVYEEGAIHMMKGKVKTYNSTDRSFSFTTEEEFLHINMDNITDIQPL